MNSNIVSSTTAITLIGGAAISSQTFNRIQPYAKTWVAADGGANRLYKEQITPAAVIGDLDSISLQARTAFSAQLHHISEQNTTDFEKGLTRIQAPQILALGFLGGRLDHSFATLNTLAKHPKSNCILISDDDLCLLVPRKITLNLEIRTPIALLPLSPCRTYTTGLKWDLQGETLTPTSLISSSNRTEQTAITIETTGDLIMTVPHKALDALITQTCTRANSPLR